MFTNDEVGARERGILLSFVVWIFFLCGVRSMCGEAIV